MNPKLCGLVSCPSLKVYTCADTEKLTVREETAGGKEMYQFYEGGDVFWLVIDWLVEEDARG